MRKKLILIIILLIFIIIFVSMENNKVVFVKNIKEIKTYSDGDIKKSSEVIDNLSNNKQDNQLGILNKYLIVGKEETQYCQKKDDTYLISNEKGFDVISYQNNSDFEYYKSTNSGCELFAKVKDVNFTTSTSETYANDSIYTNFDSLNNFELSGLVRITKDKEIPYDTIYKRYSNAIAFDKGVLLIENNQDLVAFDKDDKELFRQRNTNNTRNIYAINRVSRSLILIVEKDGQIYLEGYEMANVDSIKKAKPKIIYNITKYYQNTKLSSTDFTTKKSNYYATFTSNDFTLIVEHNFAKIYALNNADTVLEMSGSTLTMKDDEMYYVVDLSKNIKEDLGRIQALAFRGIGKELYFTVLDKDSKEVTIRFTIR